MKKPLGADLIIPALALGFAAYFFVSIADLAWEAKASASAGMTKSAPNDLLLSFVTLGREERAILVGELDHRFRVLGA